MEIGNSAKLNWSSSQIFSRAMVKIAIIVINITSRALLLIASGALLLVRRRALVLALRLWEALSAGPRQNCFIMNHEHDVKWLTIVAQKDLLFKLLLTIARLPDPGASGLGIWLFLTLLEIGPGCSSYHLPCRQSVVKQWTLFGGTDKMMMTTTMMKIH